jgi:hypothetical protein
LARLLDARGRASGRPVDHRHEPDRFIRPQVSTTVSPITISITPDCTTYMQEPGSFCLNTMLPAG